MREELLRDLYSHDDGIPSSLRDLMRTQHLELPGNSISILAQIFSHGSGAEENGRFQPYTDRLVAASQIGLKDVPEAFPINTFPFGARTADVFPEFVGACVGETTMLQALNAIDCYCKLAAENFPSDDLKTVILLTDKWENSRFQRDFEFCFLNYALQQNILFVFLLVTDYGVTRIPFLAANELELQELRRRGYSVETEHPGVAALEMLRQYSPCYFERQRGTWEQSGATRFEFDFRKNRCTISDGLSSESQVKRILPSAARRFAMSVHEFMQNSHSTYSNCTAKDAGCYRAEVFGAYFEWSIGSALDESCRKIFNAFRTLISSLKEL